MFRRQFICGTTAATAIGLFGSSACSTRSAMLESNTKGNEQPAPAPSRITIHDPRLSRVIGNSHLEKLCTGATWSEGPVWMHEDDSLLWSDIPNNRILRWSARDGMSVWRDHVDFTNGHTRDLNGDLLHCSHGRRAILRTPHNQNGVSASTADTLVVDRYQGKRLNSPNDLVVRHSDASIWFTDPPYGILSDREGHKAVQEQPACHVFAYDQRTGKLHAATDHVEHPNGLAFSPDERLLYVSDTSAAVHQNGHHQIVVFDVDGFHLKSPRIFAVVNPGLPDGLRIDSQGLLYATSQSGIQIYHPDGTHLGEIPVPEKVGNLTFGGRERNELYIVASTSLYRIRLNTQGMQRP